MGGRLSRDRRSDDPCGNRGTDPDMGRCCGGLLLRSTRSALVFLPVFRPRHLGSRELLGPCRCPRFRGNHSRMRESIGGRIPGTDVVGRPEPRRLLTHCTFEFRDSGGMALARGWRHPLGFLQDSRLSQSKSNATKRTWRKCFFPGTTFPGTAVPTEIATSHPKNAKNTMSRPRPPFASLSLNRNSETPHTSAPLRPLAGAPRVLP
jgi:hypothetical protein